MRFTKMFNIIGNRQIGSSPIYIRPLCKLTLLGVSARPTRKKIKKRGISGQKMKIKNREMSQCFKARSKNARIDIGHLCFQKSELPLQLNHDADDRGVTGLKRGDRNRDGCVAWVFGDEHHGVAHAAEPLERGLVAVYPGGYDLPIVGAALLTDQDQIPGLYPGVHHAVAGDPEPEII
mgnify:CR=1 FL=1